MRRRHQKKKVEKFSFPKKKTKQKEALRTTAILGNYLILQWVLQNRTRKLKKKIASLMPSLYQSIGRWETEERESGEMERKESGAVLVPALPFPQGQRSRFGIYQGFRL